MTLGTQEQMTSVRSPLLVQNMDSNQTIFTKPINGTMVKILFGPHGTTAEPKDVQRVPLSLAEDIDFLNALENGVLKIIGGPPDVMANLVPQVENTRQQKQAEAATASMVTVDRAQDRAMLGATCVGPNPNPGRSGLCGKQIIQTPQQAKTQPPLCRAHESLAAEFYLSESGGRGDMASGASQSSEGTVLREWKRAALAPRQQSQV